jgi:hypothetical protein
MQHQCTALGEPRQDDVPAVDTALTLALDKIEQQAASAFDTSSILGAVEPQVKDVIPGAHTHTAIQGHRLNRRVRQYDADSQFVGQSPLAQQRLEVMPIGSQTVQPDNRAARLRARFNFYSFQHGFLRNNCRT